jgi:hypothetical protein
MIADRPRYAPGTAKSIAILLLWGSENRSDLSDSILQLTNAGSLLDPQHALLLATILDTYGFGLID